MHGVHVANGCSVKTSADYTVWGGLVERRLAEKSVKRLRPHDNCLKAHSTQALTASNSEHEAIKM